MIKEIKNAKLKVKKSEGNLFLILN